MDIADWRKKIDEIDAQILQLINERAQCALKIGKLKKIQNHPILSKMREDEILKRLVQINRGPLDEKGIQSIFTAIIEESRQLQARYYQ